MCLEDINKCCGINVIVKGGLYEESVRVLLPRPPQVCLDVALYTCKGGRHINITIMDENSSAFIRICYSLSSNCVLLVDHGTSSNNIAILDDHCSIAKDEIHSPISVNLAVELAKGVDIHSVLVALEVP
ncbi:hypothetical protein SUGI_0237340 [Cryptomeria japonica]|nr:hypothetical protein SUGI_0237340 [Cryptomeria japonica]